MKIYYLANPVIAINLFRKPSVAIKALLFLSMIVLIAASVSCSEQPKVIEMPNQDTVLVSAPIREVVISVNPEDKTYTVFVLSAQTFECHKPHTWNVERLGDVINIDVYNLQPLELPDDCREMISTTQNEIFIGGEFETGKTYTVVVNGFSKSFSVNGEDVQVQDMADQGILEDENNLIEEDAVIPELPPINQPVISKAIDADWNFDSRRVVLTVLVTTQSGEVVEGLVVEASLVGPVGPNIKSLVAQKKTDKEGIATFDATLDEDGSYMFTVEYISGRDTSLDKTAGQYYLQVDIDP